MLIGHRTGDASTFLHRTYVGQAANVNNDATQETHTPRRLSGRSYVQDVSWDAQGRHTFGMEPGEHLLVSHELGCDRSERWKAHLDAQIMAFVASSLSILSRLRCGSEVTRTHCHTSALSNGPS
jgi:hypothetical protein